MLKNVLLAFEKRPCLDQPFPLSVSPCVNTSGIGSKRSMVLPFEACRRRQQHRKSGIVGVLPERHPPRRLGGFNSLDGLEQWRSSRHAALRGRQGSTEALSRHSATPSWFDEGWRARRLPLGERGGMNGRGSADAVSRAPAAAGGKVTGASRRARLLRYTDRTAPHPLDQCLPSHL